MTERSRLLMIVHSEYPVGEPRVRREADAAVAAGWDVTVFALASDDAPRTESIDGVTVVRSSVRRKRDMSAIGLMREYLGFCGATFLMCARFPRADAVVVANPPDFLVFATLPQRLKGARIVLDVHDLMTDLFENRIGAAPGSARMRLLRWLERASWRFADSLITVHGPYRDEIESRSGGRVRASVVMNSADPRFFQPRERPEAGPFTVGYHGSVLLRYGVTDLVDAFAVLSAEDPEARLVVLGGGDAVSDLTAAADRAGVADSVEASGRMLTVEQVIARIPGFSVGVIPNRPGGLNRYALSTKLMEYVAVGVPVVSAGLETLRRHFRDDEVLFYEPGDAADLARKLVQADRDRPAMLERAARARRRYEAEYSWERNAQVFLDAIEGRVR